MNKLKQYWDIFLFNFFKYQKFYSVSYQGIYGKYRVKYKDGKFSKRMDYSSASGYAEIYDGEVVNQKEYDLSFKEKK